MIKPVGHRVIVKPDEVEKTYGDVGIVVYIEDEKREQAGIMVGTIVSAGDQAWKAFSKDFDGEPWAKEGDYVFYARHAGKFIQDPYTEEMFLIMNDEDVLAVIIEGDTNE